MFAIIGEASGVLTSPIALYTKPSRESRRYIEDEFGKSCPDIHQNRVCSGDIAAGIEEPERSE